MNETLKTRLARSWEGALSSKRSVGHGLPGDPEESRRVTKGLRRTFDALPFSFFRGSLGSRNKKEIGGSDRPDVLGKSRNLSFLVRCFMSDVRDTFQRPLRDLRISVTDRCNFRCPYCMPAEVFGVDYPFLKASQLMSLPELTRILRAFVSLGVEKLRITGGEPLLRNDVPDLIRIAKQDLGLRDVALTTNGWMLEKLAPALKVAGLDRLNVSLDSLSDEVFARMNGRGFKLDRVIRGIHAAITEGFPVKINMVVQRGVNDHEIEPMAEWARERGLTLRFIEFMDVGNHNGWKRDHVVPAKEIVARLNAHWPLVATGPNYRGEVAARYTYVDGAAEIGLISSVTEPFCRDCNRARLSADGKIHTCLFTSLGWDVLGAARAGATDAELGSFIRRIWSGRMDRYSDERAEVPAQVAPRKKIEMSYIGG